MNPLSLSLVKFVGIEEDDDHHLRLRMTPDIQNHLSSMHAGAQFILAESASGAYLSHTFPDLANTVVGILRDASIKYSKPSTDVLTAYTTCSKESIERFVKQYNRKQKGIIAVEVLLENEHGETTTSGTFTWFVQNHNI